MTAVPDADQHLLRRAGDTRRPAFLAVVRGYARRRIARGLDGLWVSGLPQARAILADRPVIFAANHVAWWDALLLVVLDGALGGVGWAMMDAANLRHLPFLGWLGALPLDRSSPEAGRACLQASADLLDRPGRSLWMFPQGRQRPAHLRPLDLKPGIVTLHDRKPVDVVPVSLNYVFLERNRPAAVVRFGDPLGGAQAAGSALIPAVDGALCKGLDAIDVAARAATDGRRARTHPEDPLPGFSALVPPRGGSAQDGIGARMLQLLRGRQAHER